MDSHEVASVWELALECVHCGRQESLAELARVASPHLRIGTGRPLALWSGGIAASIHARALGYATIETTRFARIVHGIDVGAEPPALVSLWRVVSAEFVRRNARGSVHVFLRGATREDTVYTTAELPTLRALPPGTVDNIVYHRLDNFIPNMTAG